MCVCEGRGAVGGAGSALAQAKLFLDMTLQMVDICNAKNHFSHAPSQRASDLFVVWHEISQAWKFNQPILALPSPPYSSHAPAFSQHANLI